MRTDRTSFCAPCRLRFPRARRCPRCESPDIHDLRRAASRDHALRALRRSHGPSYPAPDSSSTLYGGLIALGVAVTSGALLGVQLGNAVVGLIATLLVFLLCLLVFPLLAAAFRILLGARSRALGESSKNGSVAVDRIVTSDEMELRADGSRESITGRVRATAAEASPLRHRACVAFRLVGEGPYGDVDDAEAVPFVLVTDDGERIQVDAREASIAIEPEERLELVKPDARLVAFLEERGIHPTHGALLLAEATVEDGDRVVVEGHLDRHIGEGLEAEGHDRPAMPTIREHAGSPLVVRRKTLPD